jgi:hypothetical protein
MNAVSRPAITVALVVLFAGSTSHTGRPTAHATTSPSPASTTSVGVLTDVPSCVRMDVPRLGDVGLAVDGGEAVLESVAGAVDRDDVAVV